MTVFTAAFQCSSHCGTLTSAELHTMNWMESVLLANISHWGRQGRSDLCGILNFQLFSLQSLPSTSRYPVPPTPQYAGKGEKGWSAPAHCSLLHFSAITLIYVAFPILCSTCDNKKTSNFKGWRKVSKYHAVCGKMKNLYCVITNVWHPHGAIQVNRGALTFENWTDFPHSGSPFSVILSQC